jgi:hypothetical protein
MSLQAIVDEMRARTGARRNMSGEEALSCVWFENVSRKQVAQKETLALLVLETLNRRTPIIGVLRA